MTNKTLYILTHCADYAEVDNEWYIIRAIYETLEEAEKNWKKELKFFFEDYPDYYDSCKLVKCELSEKQHKELKYHIKRYDADHLYSYDDEFVVFMRNLVLEQGSIIHWEDGDVVSKIRKNAKNNGEDPDNSEVFTKYFDQYFEQNF